MKKKITAEDLVFVCFITGVIVFMSSLLLTYWIMNVHESKEPHLTVEDVLQEAGYTWGCVEWNKDYNNIEECEIISDNGIFHSLTKETYWIFTDVDDTYWCLVPVECTNYDWIPPE